MNRAMAIIMASMALAKFRPNAYSPQMQTWLGWGARCRGGTEEDVRGGMLAPFRSDSWGERER